MVVGDSVAATVGRGLERWGRAHGVAVWNVARSWCGIARGGQRLLMGVRDNGPACDGWAARWSAQLDRFHPDLVVAMTTIWDTIERRRPEWGDQFHKPGDPEFDAWLKDELTAATDLLGSRGARVVWLTAPCHRIAAFNAGLARLDNAYLPAVVARRPGKVRIVDLWRRLCPGGSFTDQLGGIDGARPDGLHFSDAGSDWLAGWLGPELVAPPPVAPHPRFS
jgi:hypothetical protein